MRSQYSHAIFEALNPDDKVAFISKMIDAHKTELSLQPYVGFCALKYPHFFKPEQCLANISDKVMRQYLEVEPSMASFQDYVRTNSKLSSL